MGETEIGEPAMTSGGTDDRPFIELPGSEKWISGYKIGERLDRAFPGQDALDLAVGCAENADWGPCAGHRIVGLLMVQQGAKEYGHWIWLVALDDGTHWWLDGWCDYSGWDCHSGVTWSPFGGGKGPNRLELELPAGDTFTVFCPVCLIPVVQVFYRETFRGPDCSWR